MTVQLFRIVAPAATIALLLATGCGPSTSLGDPCTGEASRCNGSTYQLCQNDVFVTVQECDGQCVEGFGCGDCNPAVATACSGNDVVECNADGTLGESVTTCSGGLICNGGQCSDSCTATGTSLIYVVDTAYNLLSFNPAMIGSNLDAFTVIGELNCPGATFLDTPFSMSVDRDGMAWILYSNGSLYKASTQDASCASAGITSISGFDLFGMGFATDGFGTDTESLWLASSPEGGGCCGELGYIRDNTMTRVSNITANAETSPELTGTGAGELFAFFPDTGSAFVQQMSKTNGLLTGTRYDIGSLGNGTVGAWAFAQWGGKFYIFVSLVDEFGFPIESLVGELDAETGSYDQVLSDTAYNVVGAGVSTCAPIGPS